MDYVGIRGTTQLTEEELEAHLALALRTENVGVLLGSGTSVSAGGPTIRSLWQQLADERPDTRNWLVSEGFAEEPSEDRPPNIEEAIDRLSIAEQDLCRRGLKDSEDLKELRKHRSAIYRMLLKACLLNEKFWSGEIDPATDQGLTAHRTFLARLISTRSPGQDAPWIFSTNYDLAVEWAAENLSLEVINGFGGLHDRRFSSSRFDLGFRNVQASGLARLGSYHLYLVKLHGSLTWLRVEPDLVREVSAAHAWREIEAMETDGAEGDRLSDLVLILPNTQKYLATAGYIHGELIRRFTEFLGRPQTTLLVAGYSFNDEHLNRVVRSALNNPTLHLVIFLPELGQDPSERFTALSTAARSLVEPLIATSSPRVTFVHGETAYFETLVNLLPEPALLDDVAAQGNRIEKMLAQLRPEELAVADADD